ncbi:CHAT domain-containing protein [Acanthopleuribacter pedis]|uniref:CHAT domain-containing protein n=1 Tax=Acanthopleuribacter pedis TaxID=442870 RepID=A0A8J7U6G4_9BACT|nr:CHAT domain-containing protein [Acanthopleuribacter pedis]MBO1322757.1 CHAT domain-containing protein [Acanthopleuribacter pedis]
MSTVFKLHLARDGADRLTITLATQSGEELLLRHVPCAEHERRTYPLAPAADPDRAIPDFGDWCTLAEAVYQAFKGLASHRLTRESAAKCGAFLFHVLLGPDGWDKLAAVAGGKHLYLSTDPDCSGLQHLPWELMRLGDQYLAMKKVDVVRYCPDPAAAVPVLTAPLRVLFVVGPESDGRRADTAGHLGVGGEFIGLLRRLRKRALPMCERLLMHPDIETLKNTIAAFKPQVVHFIGHGGIHEGRPTLSFSDGQGAVERIGGEALAAAMIYDGTAPLTVLNVCHSGGTLEKFVTGVDDGSSLVIDLVRAGIPLAVGMGGRVRDTVCRLFTRRFYEALMEGESLVDAAAEGRWAAFRDQVDGALVDWARPVMVRNALTPIQMDPDSCQRAKDNLASLYRIVPEQYEETLCDRVDVFRGYQNLLQQQNGYLETLLILETQGDVREDKMGKTMVLCELAGQIMLDGYLPCAVLEGTAENLDFDYPAVLDDKPVLLIAFLLLEAARITRNEVLAFDRDEPFPNSKVEGLIHFALDPDTHLLDADLHAARRLGQVDLRKAAALAVRKDLIAIQEECGKPLFVLVDDAHLLIDRELTFLRYFVTADGLGDKKTPIPLIITCSDHGTAEQENQVSLLKNWLNTRPPIWAKNRVVLSRFSGDDRTIAYEQFPLVQQQPLVRAQQVSDLQTCRYLSFMDGFVEGVPSRLAKQGAIILEKCIGHELRKADDDDLLELYRESGYE